MRKLISILVVMFLSFSAIAEESKLEIELVDDFLSPFTTDARSILITGILTTGLAIALLEDKIYGDYHEEIGKQNIFNETSLRYFDYYGQGIPNAIYIGYWWYEYKKKDSAQAKWRATHMLKSTLHAVTMTTILKHTIRQKRPDPSDNKDSFPSGHSTSAFAFASVIAKNHSTAWGITAYTFAVLCGYQRVHENRHYIHDVLTGATIGISYGLSIYNRHFNGGGKNSDTSYLFTPTEDLQGAQMAMVRSF